MKILHFITSLQSGGAERMLSYLASNDQKHKHIIVIILESKIHYELDKNVRLIELNLNQNTIGKIRSFFLIKHIIDEIEPDIVQSWLKLNYFMPMLKKMNKKPKYVLNIRHGVRKKYNYLTRILEKKYLNYSDGCIFVSNSSKTEFENEGIKIHNSVVITNGFMEKDYEYSKQKSHDLVIGYVGRNHPIKNQKLLFKSYNEFCKNKNVQLIVAGKNMNYENFNEIITSETNEKILWLNEVDNSYDVYKKIDVLILTSYSEGFPNVIGEAMSVGVPVIATNAGESWNIIQNSGYKISFELKDLVNTLEKIHQNPIQLQHKSKLAYDIIQKNYLLKKVLVDYIEFYEGVVK